ncbi:MAG: 7-carboxy-7-deazaguanine synthase QueE [Bacteroidota bacterium]
MSKIVLAREGVFPITKDRHGRHLKEKPATRMDIPGTIQGEGKLTGVPSLFVRLAGCNLRCIWTLPDGSLSRCDTPYASFENDTHQTLDTQEVFDLIISNADSLNHIVITGGEPLLQHKPLEELLKRIKAETHLHVTIETNGTLFFEEVARHTDLFSISPKLSNSDPVNEKLSQLGLKPTGPTSYHGEKRRNIEVLQKYIDFCQHHDKEYQLKFVTGSQQDATEIQNDFLEKLTNWKEDDVMLMPLGANAEELQTTTSEVLKMAIQNGWRFSPRMHINLFGPQAGV